MRPRSSRLTRASLPRLRQREIARVPVAHDPAAGVALASPPAAAAHAGRRSPSPSTPDGRTEPAAVLLLRSAHPVVDRPAGGPTGRDKDQLAGTKPRRFGRHRGSPTVGTEPEPEPELKPEPEAAPAAEEAAVAPAEARRRRPPRRRGADAPTKRGARAGARRRRRSRAGLGRWRGKPLTTVKESTMPPPTRCPRCRSWRHRLRRRRHGAQWRRLRRCAVAFTIYGHLNLAAISRSSASPAAARRSDVAPACPSSSCRPSL